MGLCGAGIIIVFEGNQLAGGWLCMWDEPRRVPHSLLMDPFRTHSCTLVRSEEQRMPTKLPLLSTKNVAECV